jgi:hypothetical protein
MTALPPSGSRLAALLAALAAALALVAASTAPDAHAAKKGGVRAKVTRGTLEVKGNARANKIVLRGGRVVAIDVGANGSPDFRFRRSRFSRVAVRGGDGDDAIRADGAFTVNERTAIIRD